MTIHEAAHAVVALAQHDWLRLKWIEIKRTASAEQTAGGNVPIDYDEPINHLTAIAIVTFLLAGREAEIELLNIHVSQGSDLDLAQARLLLLDDCKDYEPGSPGQEEYVREQFERAQQRARRLIRQHRAMIERIADALMDRLKQSDAPIIKMFRTEIGEILAANRGPQAGGSGEDCG